MQFRFVLSFVGMYCPNVLFGFHLVTAFHRNVFKVGIHSKILAVAEDDYRIGACQFGDAGHFAVEDGTSLSVFSCGDVDAIVGYRDLVGNHRGVFTE